MSRDILKTDTHINSEHNPEPHPLHTSLNTTYDDGTCQSRAESWLRKLSGGKSINPVQKSADAMMARLNAKNFTGIEVGCEVPTGGQGFHQEDMDGGESREIGFEGDSEPGAESMREEVESGSSVEDLDHREAVAVAIQAKCL
jgi:hypothetical protein